MPKAVLLCFKDIDQGGTANEVTIKAEVVYCGLGGSADSITSFGADGSGVPIAINFNQLAQYPNNVEDALIADAARLGITIARTDCLFPDYQRGA